MNERIKEFALKAYNNAGQPTPDVLSLFMEVYSEKFTELIVQRCASIISLYKRDNLQDKAVADTLEAAYKEIKGHFGVK